MFLTSLCESVPLATEVSGALAQLARERNVLGSACVLLIAAVLTLAIYIVKMHAQTRSTAAACHSEIMKLESDRRAEQLSMQDRHAEKLSNMSAKIHEHGEAMRRMIESFVRLIQEWQLDGKNNKRG